MPVRFDSNRMRWCVEFEQNHVRVFRRLPKGCTRAQAETLEGKLRREIFDTEVLDKRKPLTIGEAIDLWLANNRRKNQRQAQSEAKQWEAWRGRLLKDAPEVAAEAVRTWTMLTVVGKPVPNASRGRRGALCAPRASTVNRRLMLLKAVCKAMWRQKRIGENLSGRIETRPEPPSREVYLTRQQVKTLASNAPSQTSRHAILIAAYSGLRASELLSLKPEDIGLSGTLTVRASTSKTGRTRHVPVPSSVRPLLRSIPLSISYWQLRKEFLASCRRSGLKGLKFHDLRHTCASWLINEGVDLYTVGRILGHTSPQTTQRYAHLATDTLEKAMARLK